MKDHIFLEMGATENSIQEQWDKVLMEKQLLFVGKMTFLDALASLDFKL